MRFSVYLNKIHFGMILLYFRVIPQSIVGNTRAHLHGKWMSTRFSTNRSYLNVTSAYLMLRLVDLEDFVNVVQYRTYCVQYLLLYIHRQIYTY